MKRLINTAGNVHIPQCCKGIGSTTELPCTTSGGDDLERISRDTKRTYADYPGIEVGGSTVGTVSVLSLGNHHSIGRGTQCRGGTAEQRGRSLCMRKEFPDDPLQGSRAQEQLPWVGECGGCHEDPNLTARGGNDDLQR